MIYLALFILGCTAFNHCLRYGQTRGANILAVVVVNYSIAAVASLVVFAQHGGGLQSFTDWPVVATSCVTGTLFFLHILVMLSAFRMLGVGIANAIIRSSVIIPAVVSWFAWNEPMTPMRWVALALVPVSTILMRRSESAHGSTSLKADLVLFLSFAIAGTIMSIHKFVEVNFSPDQCETYKSMLFLVAALASTFYALAKSVKFTRRDVALGVVIGLINAMNLLLMMRCLALIPSVVFFPTSASVEICLNVIVSWVLWKERLLKRQLFGLALAIGIVLLTNLGGR